MKITSLNHSFINKIKNIYNNSNKIMIRNTSMINHLIIITCANVCASMLPPTQASNLYVTSQLNLYIYIYILEDLPM